MKLHRKLLDSKGNVWVLEIPSDVNADSVEDILIAAHEGIVKLMAYCLDGDVFRAPSDSVEIKGGKRSYNFFKKLSLDGVSEEEFSAAMKTMLDKAKESHINKIRVSEYDGIKVLTDSRGPYIPWVVNCKNCEAPIKGIRRLSTVDGEFTRAQTFVADDKKVQLYRPGSKFRLCPDCAVQIHTPPPTEEPEAPELTPEPVEEEAKAKTPTKPKDVMDELLALSRPNSGVDATWLKGCLYGVLRSRGKTQE